MDSNDVFKQLQAQTETLAAQLKALSTKITAASKKYNDDVNALNDSIATFNRRAEDGDFSSREQFDRERAKLVSQVNTLESSRTNVQRDIQEYERLRAQYNEVADASKKLYDSIDSNLAPAPAL